MPTHREFFQDMVGVMAGIVFVGYDRLDSSEAQPQSRSVTPRQQVVVGGRRVKTVDVPCAGKPATLECHHRMCCNDVCHAPLEA